MKQLLGKRLGRLQRSIKAASLAGLAIFAIGIINESIGEQGKPEAIAQNFTGTAGIPAPRLARLKEIGIGILVPEYIPAGFALDSVDSSRCAQGMDIPCGHFPRYKIIYRNDQQLCFAIESRPIVFQKAIPQSSSKLETKTFGEATLYHGALANQPNQTKVVSEWLERDRQYYRFTQVDLGESNCQGTVEVKEAIEITESLVFVD
jgi:hypothetical protein